MSDDHSGGPHDHPAADAVGVRSVPRDTEGGYEIPMTMAQNRREFVINGRYRVFNQLGEGGFATVYRGVDENLDRPVAVKIMRAELLSDSNREAFLGRFKREAFVVAKLDHPHLTPVYETGVLDQGGAEVAYIIMKQLIGEDLEETLQRDGAMAPERVLRLMRQIIEALSYVHSKGIIHKDLKPSNVFLCEDHMGREHAYLMDFGIAHDERDVQGRMTNTGSLTGTFQYLPPEYIMHNQATCSVDVFQIGMIIYELLTGRQLNDHTVTLPLIVARYLRGEPYALDEAFEGTRGGEFLARTLDFDLDVRHADAGELLNEFMTLKPEDFPSFLGAVAADGFAPTELDAPAKVPWGESPSSAPIFRSPSTHPDYATDPPALERDPVSAPAQMTDIDLEPIPTDPKFLWLGGAIAVAIVLCLGAIAFIQSQRGEPEVAPEAMIAEAEVSEPTPPAPVVVAPAATSVKVVTDPAGATIKREGQVLGTSPETLDFVDEGEVTLELELEGHDPQTATFRPSAGAEVEVTLTATPALEADAPKETVTRPRPRIKKTRRATTPKRAEEEPAPTADDREAKRTREEPPPKAPATKPAKVRTTVTLPPRR